MVSIDPAKSFGTIFIEKGSEKGLKDGHPPKEADEYIRLIDRIISSSPFGIMVFDKDGVCINANKALLSLIGLSSPDIIGKYRILNDTILETHGLLPRIKRVFEKGETADFIIPYDISRILVEQEKPLIKIFRMTLFPASTRDSELKLVICTFEDITKRKAMEKDALERTKELSILNEVSNLIVSTASLEELAAVMANNFQRAINADCCFIMMFKEEDNRFEIIAVTSGIELRTVSKSFNNDDSEATLSRISMDKKQPITIDDTKNVKLSSIDRRIVNELGIRSLLILPMFVGDRFIGTILIGSINRKRTFDQKEIDIIMTITNQASVMFERARLFRELIEANKQIIRSYNKLKEFDKLKTDFLTITSHELRTPLTSIRGYSELLKEGVFGPLTKEQKEKLEIIDRNVSRMMSVVENLTELSHSGSINFELKKEETSIGEIVESSMNDLKPVATSKNIEISSVIPEGLPLIFTDKEKISRVMDILFDNAIKFTPPGGSIIVTVADTPKFIHVKIKDTGIGIPEEDIKKIFTGFYRVGYRPSYQYSGIGIGLAIAKAIIEAHGGRIWAESKINEGSTFHFILKKVTR